VSATAAEIARLAGAFNLPHGRVPIIDGTPHWPWDEPVAHQRLVHVAQLAGIDLTGDEVWMDSGSNDAWRIGDRVVRICWRGDIDRLLREAALADVLPDSVPHAGVDDHGRDDELSWAVSPLVAGTSLSDLWATAPEHELRDLTRQSAAVLKVLHAWTPPADLLTMLREARQLPTADSLTLTGALASPTHPLQQQTLIAFLRGMPFVDSHLLDAAEERIQAAQAARMPTAEDDVFIHGDFTPGNILVDKGEITAVLDFEYARLGPAIDDLALPWIWTGQQSVTSRAGWLLDWLREDYPQLFQVPDLAVRRQIAEFGFALRCCIAWPPDRPEGQLDRTHPLHLLRRLASAN
jgi:aminoglycoside phosphotransferase (APT) family kinase protein